jgi:hypothetical protein
MDLWWVGPTGREHACGIPKFPLCHLLDGWLMQVIPGIHWNVWKCQKVCEHLFQCVFSICNSLTLKYDIFESTLLICLLFGLVVRVPSCRPRGPRFDSQHYQIFWDVVGLEWGPFNLVSTSEELLKKSNSGSGLDSREYGHGDALCWPHNTLYPQKLALTSPTSGDHSVGIVRLRTKAMESFLLLCLILLWLFDVY